MAVSSQQFSQDLSAGAFDQTTSFAGTNILATVLATVRNADNSVSDSPVLVGIQENIKIYIKDSSSDNYTTLVHSGSFNGRADYSWVPVGNWALSVNQDIRIQITNQHLIGTVYVTVTVS